MATLLMPLMPSTRIPTWRATITSGTVDMPHASAADHPPEAHLGRRLEGRTAQSDVNTLPQPDPQLRSHPAGRAASAAQLGDRTLCSWPGIAGRA